MAIDLARSAALLGMVAFHLVFDLQMFGILPYGTTAEPFFYWHARLVAGSFLFLAGASLWLAHGAAIRWRSFWRRQARLVGAAALVSAGTYAAFPDYFVYYGILHAIALGSLIGLACLRLPAALVAGLGGLAIWASYALPSPLFDAPLLRFLGLATIPAETIDFEPVFPWIGPLLLGLAFAKTLSARGLWQHLHLPDSPRLRQLSWPGRHSLPIYLLHQPILIGLLYALIFLMA